MVLPHPPDHACLFLDVDGSLIDIAPRPKAVVVPRSLLDALAPDEVHLVLPASLRPDLAQDIARSYGATRTHCGATHLLVSKFDEVPRETGIADLALSLEMPSRWITDGQDVPADLKPGAPRLLRSYGLSIDTEPDWMPA